MTVFLPRFLSGRRALRAVLPALALPLGLLAQASPPAPVADAADENVVRLEEFTVSTSSDRGYLAGSALSATKTNTALRDLPVNMSVITEDFLRDLSAVNATDVLEYSPSLIVQHGGATLDAQIGGINSWQSQIQIRGTGTYFNLRNGFRAYEPPSSAATQRIEIIKGPASVLYGITKPGGVVNFLTKKPVFGKNEVSGSFTVGSYHRTRTTLDVNAGQLLNNQLGIRLIGSYTDTEAFSDFTQSWERAFNPSISYRPFKNTQVTAEFEITDRESPAPFNLPVFSAPGYPRSQVPFYVRPTGPDDPVAKITALVGLPAYTESASFVGEVQKVYNRARKAAFTVTQRLTDDLSLNAQFERQRRHHGVVGFGSTLQGAPQLRLVRVYVDSDNANEIDSYAVTLSYHKALKLPWVGETTHKLVAGVQRQEENYENPVSREYVAGTNTQVNHFISLSDPAGIARGPGAFVGEVRRSGFAHEDSDFDLGFVSYQGAFLADRLLLTGGVTRTLFQQARWSQSTTAAGPGAISGVTTDAQANSPLLGVMVRPAPWAGFFAQTSKSLNPNTGLRDGFGRPFAPERGDGDEVGVKLDPWAGRLTATISAFRIKELGRIVNDPNAPREDSFYLDANGNHQPISGPNDPRYNPDLPGQNKGANVAVGEAMNKGFEIEAVYTHNNAWQTMVGYSYLDAYAVRDTNNNTANYNGRPLSGSVKHQASLITKYRFTQGMLKGFDVVAGLRYRGRLFRGSFNTDGTDVLAPGKVIQNLYARDDITGDLKVGYETKLWGRQTTFAVNAYNVLGLERWRGFRPTELGKMGPDPYYYTMPATFSFTVGFKL
ncbi:TonB-dependent receptor plug domain-containing protein [Opitutus sp. ER46]|uniref:TonB-dependent siderophore receptor n=1 Tax=Opitutus sp. ER46 TaxID=2161864 RepID=UPI001304F3C8|nr:TonB-dependent receptor plug domain-containing protein [Opitutus sp. ER46]